MRSFLSMVEKSPTNSNHLFECVRNYIITCREEDMVRIIHFSYEVLDGKNKRSDKDVEYVKKRY